MKVKITASSVWTFYNNDEDTRRIIRQIKKAGLPVIKEKFQHSSAIDIYTEINNLEELNKLVASFCAPIVYSISNNQIEIEKYDTYRE